MLSRAGQYEESWSEGGGGGGDSAINIKVKQKHIILVFTNIVRLKKQHDSKPWLGTVSLDRVEGEIVHLHDAGQ